MKKLYITLKAVFLSAMVFAQEDIVVTGKVTDENHEPLIGVNIVIKDRPGLGTITDVEGNYTLEATPYNILIFTYVGYEKREIPIKSNTKIDVEMKESEGSVLNEVVVTGSGIQEKATVSGAITTVNVSSLKIPTSSITNALAGNIAGVIARQTSGQPGDNHSEFWIRGISTFGAGTGALVLVDGFERSFNEINIEDIESFSVLKDASATAIYGSKGANGVILITTKRGDAGKINVDFKSEYGYSTRTRTPEFVDGLTYAQLANEARITRNLEPIYTADELEILRLGLDPDLYPNINWREVMLRDGANQYRANLNLSGGGSTARYFVSGSYTNEEGMYKTDEALRDYNTNANYSRWNYRTNVDIDLTRTTLINIGVAGFLEKQNLPGLGNQDVLWNSIVGQTPVSIPILYSNGLVPAYGTGDRTNPWVLATQTGYRESWNNKAETNITLNQNLNFITEGLRFIGRFGYDNESGNYINRMKWPEQFNVERRRDRNGNLIMKRITTESLMHQESGSTGFRVYNFETEFSYRKKIASSHNINALVKYSQKESVTTVNIGTEIKNGIPRRNIGVSGRVMYDYSNKYFVEFNFGYTGSENFKKGHQFGFFPAVSGGWNISEESLFKNNTPWLDLLKVRYSYGKVGNDLTNTRFPFLTSVGEMAGYNFGDYISPNQYGGLHFSEVAADNLTWEVALKHNLGIDVHLFDNKFSTTLDFFQDTRSQIYMQRQHLSSIVGVSSQPWANVGKMQSRGFDGQLNLHQKVGNVHVTMRGNITYYKNEVIEYDEQANAYPYQMTQGYRWQQARGLVALGLFKDFEEIRNSPKQEFGEYLPGDIKYKDINGDGVVNDNDIVPIGATHYPNLTYGAGLSMLWKNFDFNVLFQGAGKSSYFLDGSSVYPFVDGSWGNILQEFAIPKDRWISRNISEDPSTENPNAIYPRLSYGGNPNNYRASTFWLRNGAYLRFKTLEIGYTLPKSFTHKLRINESRLYFLGHNLAVWDHIKVWDPEIASSNGKAYPPSRIFTVGLTVNL